MGSMLVTIDQVIAQLVQFSCVTIVLQGSGIFPTARSARQLPTPLFAAKLWVLRRFYWPHMQPLLN